MGSGSLSGLSGSGFPFKLRLHDLTWTRFPDLGGLTHIVSIEATGTPFEDLEGLKDASLLTLKINGAKLTSTLPVSAQTRLQDLDLSGSSLQGELDLTTTPSVLTVNVDDTGLTALPKMNSTPSSCFGISALRLPIEEDELRRQADALCDRGWVVQTSSGADGPVYDCGIPRCR